MANHATGSSFLLAASARPLAPVQRSAITAFVKSTTKAHGFTSYTNVSLKKNIQKKERAKGPSQRIERRRHARTHQPNANLHAPTRLTLFAFLCVCCCAPCMHPGNTYDFQRFSLGTRAWNRTGERHIVVGTDDPDAMQHFLCILDGNVMLQSARDDPVVCYVQVPEHMSDTRWLNANTVLCATGEGRLRLFRFDSAARTLRPAGEIKNASDSYIREIAVQPHSPSSVAVGGFDRKLTLLDLNRPDSPFVQRLDMEGVIGSVKWAPAQQSQWVGACLGTARRWECSVRVEATNGDVRSRKGLCMYARCDARVCLRLPFFALRLAHRLLSRRGQVLPV
jgi:hypothetical protein